MKLAEWARSYGVHPNTAYRWFHDGTMPVPARRLASGTIVVERPPSTLVTGRTVAYCRVSSHDQRDDLERQAGRVSLWAFEHGLSIDEVVTEVGSGLNAKRPRLARLLADGGVKAIIVEHRDRLARFGVEHLAAALSANGRQNFRRRRGRGRRRPRARHDRGAHIFLRSPLRPQGCAQ